MADDYFRNEFQVSTMITNFTTSFDIRNLYSEGRNNKQLFNPHSVKAAAASHDSMKGEMCEKDRTIRSFLDNVLQTFPHLSNMLRIKFK